MSNELLIQLLHDPLVRGVLLHLPAATDREMCWLYENCLFTLYPSHYEGWGLPVAESLARGKLCIASNSSSLPEIGGDLVDYHDPLDLFGLKELVLRALDDDGRGRREDEIRRRYRPTLWKDSADPCSRSSSRTVSPSPVARSGGSVETPAPRAPQKEKILADRPRTKRDCWCGNTRLQAFSPEYLLCPECVPWSPRSV